MTHPKRIWLPCLIFAMGLAIGGLGQRSWSVKEHRAAAAQEEKILAWVVSRNPEASIRDFHEFPALLLREAAAAGFDHRVVMAIIERESDWQPRAVSAKGAIGLMQLMPQTAKAVAESLKFAEYRPPGVVKNGRYEDLGSLADPKVNVRLGITYFREQVDRYGMTPQALRAYNRGPGQTHERWPDDRYPEGVAMAFLALAHQLPMAGRPGEALALGPTPSTRRGQ